ncbi:MAG: hypothetical protein ACRDTG_31935 [Pseudonocardiaceae bacterium]
MAELTDAEEGQRPVVALRVTSALDGREHLVAEHLITITNAGRYVGLCGRQVWAAALICPPGPPCSGCLAVRHSQQLGARRNRRTPRRGLWTRLTGRRNR